MACINRTYSYITGQNTSVKVICITVQNLYSSDCVTPILVGIADEERDSGRIFLQLLGLYILS